MLRWRLDVWRKRMPAMLAQEQHQTPRRSLCVHWKLLLVAPHGYSADSAAAAIPADVGRSVSVGRRAQSWSRREAMDAGRRTWADRRHFAALECQDLDYARDSRWAEAAGRESLPLNIRLSVELLEDVVR